MSVSEKRKLCLDARLVPVPAADVTLLECPFHRGELKSISIHGLGWHCYGCRRQGQFKIEGNKLRLEVQLEVHPE